MFWFLHMNSILGLMATSGANFVSKAHLEISLLKKMLMCQILIVPAVQRIYSVAGTVLHGPEPLQPNHHKERLLVPKWSSHPLILFMPTMSETLSYWSPSPVYTTNSNGMLFGLDVFGKVVKERKDYHYWRCKTIRQQNKCSEQFQISWDAT